MHALWHWILWMLAAMSAEPDAIAAERARCAGYANVAYASLAQAPAPPPPAPKPAPAACAECGGTGKIYRSDGGYVRCKCGACPDGRCPTKVLR